MNMSNYTINLRKYELDDAPIIYNELGCNPNIIKHTGWNPYSSIESTIQMIKQYIDNDEYSWVIEANEEIVGTIGAYDYSNNDNSIEIGYSIFESEWNKGYASAALLLACNYLTSKGVCKIKAWTSKDNIASIKILEKAGFSLVGTIEDGLIIYGNNQTKLLFEKVV